jgi:excisionase family DNA binding protein
VVNGRPPLGVHLRGHSVVVMWKVLRNRLPAEIRELERNPRIDPRHVRELRGALLDIETAAREYLTWSEAQVPAAATALVPERLLDPHSVMDTAEVAELLDKSERQVRYLCASGQLLATKVGGRWLIARAAFEGERSAA